MESASRGSRIQQHDLTDGHDESAGGGVEAVVVDDYVLLQSAKSEPCHVNS
jgi:hypothetical protein